MALIADPFFYERIIFWKPFGYYLIFLGMALEGDISLFLTGFLVSQGFFNFGEAVLILFVGALVGDSFWYCLGQWVNHSNNFASRWISRFTKSFDSHLINSPKRTIFISKFIYGFNHLMLARAGILGLRFKEFFKDDLLATVVWIFLVGGFGFLSGASFYLFKHYLHFIERALLLGLGSFFVLEFMIVKFGLRKKL